MIHDRFTLHKAPNVGVKGPEPILHPQQSARIAAGRFDLCAVAHNAGVKQKTFEFRIAESSDALRLEIRKYFAITLALAKNRIPAEAGLSSFENQKFEERPVVMSRNTPFFVVIRDRKIIPGPTATPRIHRSISSSSTG